MGRRAEPHVAVVLDALADAAPPYQTHAAADLRFFRIAV
jgi:hypothetical protein